MNKETTERLECQTTRVDIFIAGNSNDAEHICRLFCNKFGACVHVERINYIYTGGSEVGVKIGLINYPRFPAEMRDIWHKAELLAADLMVGMCQASLTIVGPDRSIFISRRDSLPSHPSGEAEGWS